MKFTLNSLFGLTTVSAVVIGLIAVAVRVALDSEVMMSSLISGIVAALFGIAIGLQFARQPLATMISAAAAFVVGGTFAIGFDSGALFATSVLGYCLIASIVVLAASAFARFTSRGQGDPFQELLTKRFRHGVEPVEATVVEESLPPVRQSEIPSTKSQVPGKSE